MSIVDFESHVRGNTRPELLVSRSRYTEYAGLAVAACILVNFGTPHGKSLPEVGNGFRIDANGRKDVSPFSRIFGTSDQNIIPPTPYLRPIQNFFSLTVCS